MILRCTLFLIVMGMIPALAPGAAAETGWQLELQHAEAAPGRPAEIWLSGEMIRAGEPGLAQEVILGAEEMTVLDHMEKNFMVITYAQIEALLGPMMKMMEKTAQAQRDALRESMGDLSPGERAEIEKELRELERGDDPGYEIRKTGEKATVAGLEARKLEVVEDGRITGEIWVNDRIPMTGVRRLVERFEPLLPRMPMGSSRYWSTTGLLDGFPLRIVDLSGEEPSVVMEVTGAEPRKFAEEDFQPPPGYTRTPLSLEGFGRR